MKKRYFTLLTLFLSVALIFCNPLVFSQEVSKNVDSINYYKRLINIFSEKSLLYSDKQFIPNVIKDIDSGNGGRRVSLKSAFECIDTFPKIMKKKFGMKDKTSERSKLSIRVSTLKFLLTKSEFFYHKNLLDWIVNTACFDSLSTPDSMGSRIIIKTEFGIYTKKYLRENNVSSKDSANKIGRIGIFLKAYIIPKDSSNPVELPSNARNLCGKASSLAKKVTSKDDPNDDHPTAFDLGNLDP